MTTARLLTWNVWGTNADWRAREGALAAAMTDAGADIVAIQEAWSGPDGSTQAGRLATAAYLRDLQACGRPAATQRSCGMDLLRWFRFLQAVGAGWDQATRVEARDFISWLQVTGKPGRPAGGTGGVNSVTGKPVPGDKYAPATVAHCETVLRSGGPGESRPGLPQIPA